MNILGLANFSKLKLTKILAWLAASVVLLGGDCSAARVVVHAEGVDRQSALRSAFREAVERVSGAAVVSRSTVSLNTVVVDDVVARSSGFVNGFTVLKESTSGGLTVVDVDVDVDDVVADHGLAQRRAMVTANLGSPRVRVDVNGEQSPAVVLEALRSAGVDSLTTGTADWVLTVVDHGGGPRPVTSPGFAGWFTTTAVLDARLASGQTALWSTVVRGVGLDLTPELSAERASTAALGELGRQLRVKIAELSATPGHRVAVVIVGLGVGEANRLLTGVVGVSGVITREVSSSAVTVDVDGDLLPAELALRLAEYGSTRLTPSGVTLVVRK